MTKYEKMTATPKALAYRLQFLRDCGQFCAYADICETEQHFDCESGILQCINSPADEDDESGAIEENETV
jgi:hypothetical protein